MVALLAGVLAVPWRAWPQAAGENVEEQVSRHLAAARSAETQKDYLAAAEEYRAILVLRPDWALIHQSLGVTYHLAGRWTLAIAQLQEAVRLDDQLWGALLFLGMDYYQTHRFEEAIGSLERSLAVNPQMVETRRWLGLSHAAVQRYEVAIDHLRHVTDANPADAEGLFHLARTYERRASQLFQSIGQREPESPFVYLLQAERLASEGDMGRARAEYARAISLRPDLEGALGPLEPGPQAGTAVPGQEEGSPFDSVRAHYRSGRFLEASSDAAGILASQPGNTEGAYWMGRSYQGLALATLDRLVQAAPHSYRVDQLQGELHEGRTEYGKAAGFYREALRKQPDVPGLRYLIGSVHWKTGEFETAQQWLEDELSRNAHHVLARYRLGNVLLARDRPREAIPHLAQALEANPGLQGALFDLGRAYLEDGQFARAAAALEEYAAVDAGSDRVHYLLGTAYRGLGRLEDAQRHLRRYQELSRQRLRRVQQDVRSVTDDLRKVAP